MDKRTGLPLDGLLCEAVAAVVAVLAGCGGGLQLGIGSNRNDPPAVTLVADAASGARGGDLVLIANATDDDAVARVEFYRLGVDTALGSATTPPYFLKVKLPTIDELDTSPAIYFARAVDSDGESTNSAQLNVTLTN